MNTVIKFFKRIFHKFFGKRELTDAEKFYGYDMMPCCNKRVRVDLMYFNEWEHMYVINCSHCNTKFNITPCFTAISKIEEY